MIFNLFIYNKIAKVIKNRIYLFKFKIYKNNIRIIFQNSRFKFF